MKLDKNKTYFLGRLTKKEKRELFDYLKANMVNWRSAIFKDFAKGNYLIHNNGSWVYDNSTRNKHVCAKELFNQPLKLENVQVDCSGLSSEQINKAFDVYLQNGFEYYKNEETAKKIHAGQCTILIVNENKEVVLVSPQQHEVVEDHIMEYDKFMELFGSKPKGHWLVDNEVGNEKWLAYLDFEKEIIYGFNMDGVFSRSNNDRKILGESESIANQATVFKRLQEHAIKLGFVESENNRFTLDNNVFYLGSLPIMRDGVWAEVLNQNIGVVGQEGVDYVSAPKKQSLYTDIDYEELFKQNSKISSQVSKEETLQTVLKPSQYQIGIDTFERAEANLSKDEILAVVRFNIDKYAWRNKGQDKEDLEKIIAYAKWGLKNLPNV